MWLKDKVEKLIKKYKTTNPFEIASRMNIHVIEWDLHEEIKGFYQYEKRNRIIFINMNLENNEKIVVCAHELGHAVLHPKVSTPFIRKYTLFSVDKIEREANLFAAELLIPDDCFQEYDNIFDIASAYQVPVELAKLKCEKYF